MSTPTAAGLLVGVIAIILSVVLDAPAIVGAVFVVALIGWAAFAGRDFLRRRRAA